MNKSRAVHWPVDLRVYLTGYFFADGHLGEKPYELSYRSIDLEHLEWIHQWTGGKISEVKPVECQHNMRYNLVFADHIYYKWLVACGITSRKTYSGIPWLNFGDYQHSFVRGFTDGDGHISVQKNKYPIIEWACFDEQFLNGIRSYYNIASEVKSETRGKGFRLRLTASHHCKWLLELLYLDAQYYMPRKYSTAMRLLERL